MKPVVCKARFAFGFLKRWLKDFEGIYVTKGLYTGLIRPLVEYASLSVDTVEGIHRQFPWFALRGLQ